MRVSVASALLIAAVVAAGCFDQSDSTGGAEEPLPTASEAPGPLPSLPVPLPTPTSVPEPTTPTSVPTGVPPGA